MTAPQNPNPDLTPHYTAPQQVRAQQEQAPAVDPRAEALYARAAEQHVKEALSDLDPQFQNLFANLVLGNEDAPLDLDRQAIRALVADYARENGFKPSELLKDPEAPQRGERAGVKPIRRPATASGAGRATAQPRQGGRPTGPDGKPAPLPQSLQEWQANREQRIREALGN